MVSTVCIHFREMILFSQVPAASQSERVCININMGQVVTRAWREWARTTQLCRAPWWHGRHSSGDTGQVLCIRVAYALNKCCIVNVFSTAILIAIVSNRRW